jgi:hypothetical protein
VPLLNGQNTPSATTPLAGLNHVMGGPAEGESLREQGEDQFERVLQWASRNSDQLDGDWDRGARFCVANAAPIGGDRVWFAVYMPDGVRLARSNAYDCFGWLNDLKNDANQIRNAMDKSAEVARRGGVSPGTIRDLRHKSRLDSDGWER